MGAAFMSRRTVGLIQLVLIPENVALASAVPDGRQIRFTDNERWVTSSGHTGLAVQYCLPDEDVAFARVRSDAANSGLQVDDLVTGPGLLTVELSEQDAADLTTPSGLAAAGLPALYPSGANKPAVRTACRAAGDKLITDGEKLVCVSPPEPQVRTKQEVLAVVPGVSLTVKKRRAFGQWVI